MDFRVSLRALLASPVVTLTVVVSLALGIGANTAIFSLADSLLVKTLPVQEPDRLVRLLPGSGGLGQWRNLVWEQIRDQHHVLFQRTFASSSVGRFNLAERGQADLADGFWASGDYFNVLGVTPLLGRMFSRVDDQRGGGPDGPVAVISYAFWQRRFGGSPDVIGKTQLIERVAFTIVGVTPPDFFGTEVGTTFDLIVPVNTEPLMRGARNYLDGRVSWLQVMARLKPGQTLAAADQAFRGVTRQLREPVLPPGASAEVRAQAFATPVFLQSAALGTSLMRTKYRLPLLALMGIVALVLLIACANIANLLLARAVARRHELAVRRALGASRWSIARQLLIESLILAVAGAAIGMAIAQWLSRLLLHQLSAQTSTPFLDTQIDWRLLAFTTTVTVASALLFGIVPALYGMSAEPIEAIREQGRGPAGERRRVGFGGALVAVQVALSLVLVVAASLLGRTFTSLATKDLGFERDPVVIARLNVTATKVDPAGLVPLYERVADAVRRTPGVASAAVSDITPISGSIVDTWVDVEHVSRATPPNDMAYQNVLSRNWFATYGTAIVAGRDFDDRDRIGSPPVVIVNETFVRRFQIQGSPIGRRIRTGRDQQRPWMEIVGMVADASYRSLRDPAPSTIYLPMAQLSPDNPPSMRMSLSVRAASGSPAHLSNSIIAAIGGVDRDIVVSLLPLKQQVDAALAQERMLAMVSGFFGGLALLLAAVGLYGITSHFVTRRRHEMSIRLALGAAPSSVVWLVLSRISLLIGLGVVGGLVLSAWTSSLLAPLLYGLEARDPITAIAAVAALGTVGTLASWVPAYRASRIPPANILRDSQ